MNFSSKFALANFLVSQRKKLGIKREWKLQYSETNVGNTRYPQQKSCTIFRGRIGSGDVTKSRSVVIGIFCAELNFNDVSMRICESKR